MGGSGECTLIRTCRDWFERIQRPTHHVPQLNLAVTAETPGSVRALVDPSGGGDYS